jgi:hypothetical protein
MQFFAYFASLRCFFETNHQIIWKLRKTSLPLHRENKSVGLWQQVPVWNN